MRIEMTDEGRSLRVDQLEAPRGRHARKKNGRVLIPRGDSEVGDVFLYGEGFIPGGSFTDWIESGIFDKESSASRFASGDAEKAAESDSSSEVRLSEVFANRSRGQKGGRGRASLPKGLIAAAIGLVIAVIAGAAVFLFGSMN